MTAVRSALREPRCGDCVAVPARGVHRPEASGGRRAGGRAGRPWAVGERGQSARARLGRGVPPVVPSAPGRRLGLPVGGRHLQRTSRRARAAVRAGGHWRERPRREALPGHRGRGARVHRDERGERHEEWRGPEHRAEEPCNHQWNDGLLWPLTVRRLGTRRPGNAICAEPGTLGPKLVKRFVDGHSHGATTSRGRSRDTARTGARAPPEHGRAHWRSRAAGRRSAIDPRRHRDVRTSRGVTPPGTVPFPHPRSRRPERRAPRTRPRIHHGRWARSPRYYPRIDSTVSSSAPPAPKPAAVHQRAPQLSQVDVAGARNLGASSARYPMPQSRLSPR